MVRVLVDDLPKLYGRHDVEILGLFDGVNWPGTSLNQNRNCDGGLVEVLGLSSRTVFLNKFPPTFLVKLTILNILIIQAHSCLFITAFLEKIFVPAEINLRRTGQAAARIRQGHNTSTGTPDG